MNHKIERLEIAYCLAGKVVSEMHLNLNRKDKHVQEYSKPEDSHQGL